MKIVITSKVLATETPRLSTVLSIPSMKRAVPALSASRAAGKRHIKRRRGEHQPREPSYHEESDEVQRPETNM